MSSPLKSVFKKEHSDEISNHSVNPVFSEVVSAFMSRRRFLQMGMVAGAAVSFPYLVKPENAFAAKANPSALSKAVSLGTSVSIAGPKILEHIVDVVLQFEGDSNNIYRILRGIKNRFGATFEIGVFEMLDAGLRGVDNPSEILLTHYEEPLSGIAVGASADGVRPYLIEVQALVSGAAYGTPQRSTTGYDARRMNMLLAVLEKRVGMKMFQKDVFLNFAGGFKVADPGLDLAVVAAVISSYYDRPVAEGVCCAGEIGLSGEVRPAPRTEQRISEAARLGFRRIIVSGYLAKGGKRPKGIEVVPINSVDQLPKALFTE